MKHELLPVKAAPGLTIHSVHKTGAIIQTDADDIFPYCSNIFVQSHGAVWASYDWFCHFVNENSADTNLCGYLCFPSNQPAITRVPVDFFPPLSQKLRDDIWEMKVLIQALMVSVTAWVLPTNIYKVPLLLLGMKPQLFFYLLWLTQIWWNLCCWSHTHCKSHLQSHWVMAIFLLPWCFSHSQWLYSIIPAAPGSYLSTHPGVSCWVCSLL